MPDPAGNRDLALRPVALISGSRSAWPRPKDLKYDIAGWLLSRIRSTDPWLQALVSKEGGARETAAGWEAGTSTKRGSKESKSWKLPFLKGLKVAGIGADFASRALLPDWWEDECWHDPRLAQELEIRVARFLGCPLQEIAEGRFPTRVPQQGVKLRRARGTDRRRLSAAIHAALKIAEAAARNLRPGSGEKSPGRPPQDAFRWRGEVCPSGGPPSLRAIASDLWARGIPVLPLEVTPGPSFQGMACLAEGRPVILLGHRHDEPGRASFVVAHEAGHIAWGDCEPGRPVVDADEEIADDASEEVRADQYAASVLMGGAQPPSAADGSLRDFKNLAKRAAEIERQGDAEATSAIFAWASQTRDYATATMAVKALYRAKGARQQLREMAAEHLDAANAPETDRALLRCVTEQPPDESGI